MASNPARRVIYTSGHGLLTRARNPYARRRRRHRRNPIIRNAAFGRRRRHRRNPIIRNPSAYGITSIQGVMRNPGELVSNALIGSVSAYLTNTTVNLVGLFQGTDLVSKLLRMASRVATGVVVYGAARSFMPKNAPAAAVGAGIGSVGAGLLDILGTRLVLGVGDTAQTPMTLFAGVGSMFGMSGYRPLGAYTRPMGAYTRPMGALRGRGMGGIYGGSSMSMTGVGRSIYS